VLVGANSIRDLGRFVTLQASAPTDWTIDEILVDAEE